jgi:hypothetical protein
MKRPNSAINRLGKKPKNGLFTNLPGVGKFSSPSFQVHHPHCPERNERKALSVSDAREGDENNLSNNPAASFPLSPQAV